MTKDDEAAVPDETAVPEEAKATEETEATELAETEATELDETGAAEDATESDDADDAPAAATKPAPRTLFQRLLVPVALAVFVAISIGVATWAYVALWSTDQQTNDAAKATAIKAASDGTTALLSYSPESLDKDFATAKTHLTGDFLNYYTQFTHDIVTPAAREKAVKTSAVIVQSAVSEIHPDSAVVLLYLNQTTTSKENPNGSFTASSVKVGLKKIDDSWLISSFDPV